MTQPYATYTALHEWGSSRFVGYLSGFRYLVGNILLTYLRTYWFARKSAFNPTARVAWY